MSIIAHLRVAKPPLPREPKLRYLILDVNYGGKKKPDNYVTFEYVRRDEIRRSEFFRSLSDEIFVSSFVSRNI